MHVTVCVCTRNRGSSIVTTLRSLAASSYEDFDVVVVDQSVADDTAQAVQETVADDARFRYVRSLTVGVAVARNIAIAQAAGPIIAFTDDDCEAPPEWLSALVEAFRQHPQVGEVCGVVQSIPYDPEAGHIPVFLLRRRQKITSPWAFWRAGGISANMAFRQEALQAAGPFDELLGPGGPLYAGEDRDMTYRILKAGYQVVNVPEAVVIHSGFRSWKDGGKLLVRHAYFGLGAIFMKHIRVGDMAIVPTIMNVWLFHCISWRKLLLLRRGSGLPNLVYYGRGFRASFHYPINRLQRCYERL